MFITLETNTKKSDRSHKGKSLIDFPSNYTVVDLETTGFSPEYDSIIEMAAIKIRDNQVIDSFVSLTNEGDVYIDDYITELTGITQEMIDSAPSLMDTLPKFLDFISDDIIIGHNVNFDINFIYDNALHYLNKPLCNNFIDTMRLSRRLHPELPHHRLIDLVRYYSLYSDGSHRAMWDCHTTFSCYNAIREDIIIQHENVENFIKLCHRKKTRYNPNAPKVHAADITATTNAFDESHPLYQKVCVFTGKLERMPRKDAMQIVVNLGGINADGVTKNTNFLILGNNDYCTSIKDGKSSKQKKAEKLKLNGCDIEIIPENVFYDMISEDEENVFVQNTLPDPSSLNDIVEKETSLSEINESVFWEKLSVLLDSIVLEQELPQKSLHVSSNISNSGEKAGQEISKSICIYEPDYPTVKLDIDNPGKNYTVMNIQTKQKRELLIRINQFNAVQLPITATTKPIKSNASFVTVSFGLNDDEILNYIKENILYCLKHYSSKAKTFGCCSQFKKCSDAMKCVHVNKLYSTSCMYRHHLEAGRISYGKNKNI